MAASTCEKILGQAPHFQIPGLSESDSTKAICRAQSFVADTHPEIARTNGRDNPEAVAQAIMGIRTTKFDGYGQKVVGGLQHFVSVDNGAAYWELWGQGGNWYAVTGAGPTVPLGSTKFNKAMVQKGEVEAKPHLISGVVKGMSIEQVLPRFIAKAFGAGSVTGGGRGCNCGHAS